MTTFALRAGTTFELDGAAYRIERVHQDNEVVLQRLADGRTVLKTPDELFKAYNEGRLSSMTEVAPTQKPLVTLPLVALTEKQQTEYRRRHAYVTAMLGMGQVIFSPECLGPMKTRVAAALQDAYPPGTTTLWRWFTRFQAFQDARALIPRYPNRGSRLPRQTQRVMELLADAVHDAFKASPKSTGGDVHTLLIGKIAAENRQRLPGDLILAPSKRTTHRLLQRVEAYDQVVLREGQAAADRRFRIAKAGPRTTNILERVEADHTPLDLFLVDEKTWLPLGRPILTMFLDHYSRLPLGYFLNFGSTSASAVMGALRHAILPKEPAAEVIPGLKVQHRWPCYGRMDSLVLDNGLEFLGKDLEGVALDLFIRLQFCPKRTPRFKGSIERFLKTVNYFFAHQIPGAAMANLAERGDYDPQRHALLTMAEFKQVFEKWLLDVYAQTVHRGIGTTPWAKWHEGASRRTPELPASIKTLKQRIGLVHERALRPDGIKLDCIRYADDNLDALLKKWGPGSKVRIVVDAEDLGEIQVWGHEEADPVTVLAVDQNYARGLTIGQHELFRQKLRKEGRDAENTAELMAAKYEIALELQELMTSRKQRTRRKAAKVHGITSSTPHARLETAPPPKRVKSKPPAPVPKPSSAAAAAADDELPPLLPSFNRPQPGLSNGN